MTAKILEGSVFDLLPTLQPGSVDAVVTSPPYHKLRSYLPKGHPLKSQELGSESTVKEFISTLVRVFDLVRIAMADHATCWLNIGDSYSSGGNLCLIPQRLAIALQEAGWLVRSVVVWHKPSCMPASLSGWSWRRCRVKVGGGWTAETHPSRSGVCGDIEQSGGVATGKKVGVAEWADCPGCAKCCKIKGGDDRCFHEWELKPCPDPLPFEAKPAVVDNAGKAGAVLGVQLNNIVPDSGAASPSNQDASHGADKPTAGRAELDTAILPDAAVTVEKPANKIRKKRNRNVRENHNVGLPRDNTEEPKALSKGNASELDAPDRRAVLGEFHSEGDGGADLRLNKLSQGQVSGGEVKGASITNVPVSEDQPESVCHVPPPHVEEPNINPGLPPNETAESIALRGTEAMGVSPLLPGGPVELFPTSETFMMGATSTTGVGTMPVASSLGGNNVNNLVADNAIDIHADMICKKCGAVKYHTPNGGYVLRKGSWRPTSSSWEPVLMLAKSANYFSDGESVKQPSAPATVSRNQYTRVLDDPDEQFAVKHDHETTSEGANLRDVWTIAAEPLKEKHYACVDAETECLTAGGWKRWDELKADELLAQFDMETEKMVWGPLRQVNVYHVMGEEIIMQDKAKRLSVAFTKNHRCVIRRRTSPGATVVDAIDIKRGHQIVTHAPWDYQGTRPFDESFAELLGWYIAEGHEHKNSSAISIYQSLTANAPFVARIEGLLKAVRAEYEFASYHRIYQNRQTVSGCFRVTDFIAYKLREVAPGKEMPGDCLLWETSIIEAFLRGLIDGDGHTRTDGRRWFTQKNKRTADFLQAMMLRTGNGATVSNLTGMYQVSSAGREAWSMRGTNGSWSGLPLAKYTGVLWCPTTDKGTWMARRNGKHFVTGNSFPTELVYRCLAAGTSSRGYCVACGKPWVRVLDGGKFVGDLNPKFAEKVNRTTMDGKAWAAHHAENPTQTIGWRPSCPCNAGEPRPGLVLDCFSGSGRTGLQAQRMGLDYIGVELNSEYCELSRRLLYEANPLFS